MTNKVLQEKLKEYPDDIEVDICYEDHSNIGLITTIEVMYDSKTDEPSVTIFGKD